jgi:hypothetical protein
MAFCYAFNHAKIKFHNCSETSGQILCSVLFPGGTKLICHHQISHKNNKTDLTQVMIVKCYIFEVKANDLG